MLPLDGLVVLAELDYFGTYLALQGLHLVLKEFICELQVSVGPFEFFILVAVLII